MSLASNWNCFGIGHWKAISIAQRTVAIHRTKTQTNKPKLTLKEFQMRHLTLTSPCRALLDGVVKVKLKTKSIKLVFKC